LSSCWNGAEEAGCQACVQHSLQVREVVVVEEAGCQAYERLSPGERVRGGSENSWKGSCSCHKAQRILVCSVAEAQGKGGLASKGLSW
jgi:hypothetical protein